ncbi:alcohol dehydrogenase [Sphaerosporella brunnea]|uniref:Alcohol dehydrogenase n=1 Tax=Sphaerosporella brunnea TaxID=1250544 RepID=A0A5J5F7W6_9PEZI|nr:alcohol dehydrogenase [Sphaerosporella brunnea]
MKAVVFHGPKKVAVEDRPVPTIQDPTDAIVKVSLTALCGSELHVFRGHQPSDTGFIMGHEFTGEVVSVGSAVKGFKPGDKVLAPFTTSCLDCFYCRNGETSRCEKVLLFGCPKLDGAQAEYVRVPLADGTLFPAPPEIPEETVVLMADIFPTGFFAARNAFATLPPERHSDAVAVLIGCGPVGLCALVAALEYKPKHIFAIDSVPSRLELARALGAEPLNFAADGDALKKRILEVTQGRGADVVLEVVGLAPALRMAYEVVRPFGAISSVGVHNAEIPITGNEAYDKNLKLQFGRCPVRAMFPLALEVLKKRSHLFGFMADKIMPLTQAVEGYDLFDQMKVQKVIFRADQ